MQDRDMSLQFLVRNLVVPSVAIWAMSFAVVFFLRAQTNDWVLRVLDFRPLMICATAFASWFALKQLYAHYNLDWIHASFIIAAIHIILDILILILIMQLPTDQYAFSLLPTYIVSIPIINFTMKKLIKPA
jgi:hypothetical protein